MSVLVYCTKKTWTKVVENKTVGNVYLQGNFFRKAKAYFVHQNTGGPSPDLSPGDDGSTAVMMDCDTLPFSVSSAIDIYLWPPSRDITAVVDAE